MQNTFILQASADCPLWCIFNAVTTDLTVGYEDNSYATVDECLDDIDPFKSSCNCCPGQACFNGYFDPDQETDVVGASLFSLPPSLLGLDEQVFNANSLYIFLTPLLYLYI
jgi:hypothetical protein